MVWYCALGRRRQIATLARTPKLSGFILLRIQSSASQIGFLHSTGKEPCDWRAFSRTTQLEPSFTWSDGVFAAGRSIGSLKYKHHFGLDCFSMGENTGPYRHRSRIPSTLFLLLRLV
jgi:hypothetical protein